MYERSAIVLERYFNNVLGYSSENNLKINFENYCNLVERLEEFQNSYTQEQTAVQEFNTVTEEIRNLQKSQEKIYKKNAKLEFNRNILFNNVEENPEETEKCILKIEEDVDKNNESLKSLREKFIALVNEFNEKKIFLNQSKKDRKSAEKNYNEIFKIAEKNANNINEFNLEFARNFTGTQIKEKLVALMIENGSGEKVPFDENVIESAADLGLDIAQRELECYVDMYDNTLRLLDEIAKDCIKLEKFKKRMRNTKIKLNFLFAEKEYLVQFLDYERITAVNGKRTHKKLMEEACENLKADVVQINNLYELILREIATKSTKKGYKELYNKSYLLDIKEKEAKFKKEKNKVNINVGTVLNSNYWRIEGIKNIYTVFYNDISEAFGRDLDEFEVPEDTDEGTEENVEIILEEPVEKEVEEVKGIEKVEQEKVNMFENASANSDDDDDSDENIEFVKFDDEDNENVEETSFIKFDDEEEDNESTLIKFEEENNEEATYVNFDEEEEESFLARFEKEANNEITLAKFDEEVKEEKSKTIKKTKKSSEKLETKQDANELKENSKESKKSSSKGKTEKENVAAISIEEKINQIEDIKASLLEEIIEQNNKKEIVQNIKKEEKSKQKEKTKNEVKKDIKENIENIEQVSYKLSSNITLKEEPTNEETNTESKKENKNYIQESREEEEEDFFKEFNLERQKRESMKNNQIEEDIPFEDEGEMYEEEDEEESLFGNIKSVKKAKKSRIDFDMLEQMEQEQKAKSKTNKKGLFNSLIKMNSKSKKKVTN